ncbi:MAG: VanW family protein [Bacillota bacterium]|nr:VanW family protein [Bacillota bacterium]
MNTEIQRTKKTISKKRIKSVKRVVMVSVITLIILTAMFGGFSLFTVLNYNKVYNGVYVNGFKAEGLTSDDLKRSLKSNYLDSIKNKSVILKYKKTTLEVPLSDLNFSYNIDKAVEEAYSIARSGNIFKRVYEVLSTGKDKKTIQLSYNYKKDKLDEAINKLSKSITNPVKNPELKILDDKVILKSGHIGEDIDKTATYQLIEAEFKKSVFSPIDVPTTKTKPAKMDIENYYKQISMPPKDAKFETNGKTYSIKEHVNGRSIDKSALASIVSDLELTEDSEKVLPVIFTKPKITVDDLYSKLFKDELSSFSTHFNTGSKNDSNRGVNIRLAASKIDGKILGAGDTFSFNETVGERTPDDGYQTAHTYVAGKVVDGIGGGICQVSTTLYNAILLSDLDVLRRSNHQFTVSYVPFGTDAAVSYPDVDLKFRNSTKWPLKIKCWVSSDNNIYFSLLGTNDTPNKKVIINTKTIKKIDFETKYTDDPTMNAGATSILTSGAPGYVIDTYKIVKIGDKVISDSKINSSYYRAMAREIKRGTKKTSSIVPTSAKPTPKPKKTVVTGVDDADNPPVNEHN